MGNDEEQPQQAMTRERLAEIRQRLALWQRGYWLAGEKAASLIQNGGEQHEIAVISAEHPTTIDMLTHAYADEADLLTEVEWRRAREAALVTVVRAVADATEDWEREANHSWLYFDDAYAASDLQAQARALLASAGEAVAGEQQQGEE